MTLPYSPLPWMVIRQMVWIEEGPHVICDCGVSATLSGKTVEANAALIVTAVNNYEKMRKALEELAEAEHAYRTVHDQFGDGDMRAGKAWDRMRRAGDIARAALTQGSEMSDKRFLQDGFEKRLAHFIEECGEALAAAGKTQRWGPFSVNPFLPERKQETNLVWLRRELADVREALDRLEASIDADEADAL